MLADAPMWFLILCAALAWALLAVVVIVAHHRVKLRIRRLAQSPEVSDSEDDIHAARSEARHHRCTLHGKAECIQCSAFAKWRSMSDDERMAVLDTYRVRGEGILHISEQPRDRCDELSGYAYKDGTVTVYPLCDLAPGHLGKHKPRPRPAGRL
jgi:predicted Fe-S protein YdhL (DUF1289 family)